MRSDMDRFRSSTAAEQRRCLLELIHRAAIGKSSANFAQVQNLFDCSEGKMMRDLIATDLEYGDRVSIAEQLLGLPAQLRIWPARDSLLFPNEIWLMIFEFIGFNQSFYHVRHACRYLFDASGNPAIWRSTRSLSLPLTHCLEARDHCIWMSRMAKITSLSSPSDFLASLYALNPELRLASVRQVQFQDHDAVVDSDLIRCLRICGQSLQKLDLTRCKSLSDTGIQAIGELCPNLEHVEFEGCQLLTDASMHHLPVGVKHLSISRCSQITDTGIYSFCSSSPASVVEHLDLNLCSRITERGLLAIANSCPNLCSLLMAETGTTPRVIAALPHTCHYLQKIDISFGVADGPSLFSLMHGCRHLRHIIAVGAQGIDIALAANLRTQYPDLRLERYREDVIPGSRALIPWR